MDGTIEAGPAAAGRRRMAPRSKVMLSVAAAALVAIAVIVLMLGNGPAKAKASPPPTAKSFTLPALGHPGQQVSLAALAGKPVIINFFASWCEPCKRETPLLARFYQSQQGKVLIIGVDSNDEAAKAMAFVRAEGVSYPVASDPFPSPVTVSYGVLALPQTFFLNAQHKIVRHIFGALTSAELTAWARSLAGHSTG
jgi:cytochrome c biogenesis protein CcmG/thiol:disulfide interchange protein DsbE